MAQFINYLYIGYIILWPLFFKFVLPIDGSGRIYMLLSALMLLVNLLNEKFRNILRQPSFKFWIIWVLYALINWILAGIPPVNNVPTFSFIFDTFCLPLLSMWVVAYEMQRRPYRLVKLMIYLFTAYILLGLILQGMYGGFSGRDSLTLGNGFALTALCLIVIACIGYATQLLNKFMFFSLVAIATYAIFMVATRKAFLGELIILIFFYLSKYEKINTSRLVKTLALCLAIFSLISLVLPNTEMGERFMSLEEDAELYNTSNYKILSLLGDRAYFYIVGWDMFLDNPINGIGIQNFMSVTEYPLPIHSEYIVQLVENGIIGFCIYLMFVVSLFKTTKKINIIPFRRISYGWLLCMLFISFTAWVYDMAQFFMIYGIFIGVQINKHTHEKNTAIDKF